MQNSLLINGDDMGLSIPINESIDSLIRAGRMDRASIMVRRGRDPFLHACGIARAILDDGIDARFGLHLDLDHLFRFDECGRYGSNEHDMPEGYREIVEGNLLLIEEEIEEQISALEEEGIAPSHLDGHHHVHLVPEILEISLRAMKKHSISRTRFVPEYYADPARAEHSFVMIRDAGISAPDRFIDLAAVMAGREQISAAGVTEIMAHTCTSDNRMGRVDQYRFLMEWTGDKSHK